MSSETEDLQQSSTKTDGNQQADQFKAKTELHLSLIKDEIANQANTFDQIDSKTGVALGFTFVVIGQVLAAVFRIATDQSRLQSSHPAVATALFVIASGLAVAAIVFGIVARWPRNFHSSVEFNEQGLRGSYEDMARAAIDALSRDARANQSVLSTKGRWALITYLLVGGALIGYLALTVVLYVFSIPISNKQQATPINGAGSTSVAHAPQANTASSHQQTESSTATSGTLKPDDPRDIAQRVNAIIVEQLQVDQSSVKPSANLRKDLGADDLDVVELVMQIEEAFDLQIPDEDAKKLATVGDVEKYVEHHVKKRT